MNILKSIRRGLVAKVVVISCLFAFLTSVIVLSSQMIFFPSAHPQEAMNRIVWAAVTTGLVVLFTGILGALLTREVLRPVTQLTKIAQVAATGDLSVDVQKLSDDELGDLSESFAMMIKRLRGSISRIQRLAYVDSVTDLPNRAHFKRLVEGHISMAKVTGHVGAILFMDMDRFKTVNDTLGHALGDRLLEMFAERIKVIVQAHGVREMGYDSTQNTIVETDGEPVFARLGGDEFTVLLPKISQPAEASRLAQRILRSLQDPFELGGQSVTIGASIGIACFPSNGEDYDTLMRNADTAMYHAKELGRNNYQFFSADLNRRALERLVLEGQLREAIMLKQFEVFYQPQVDARSRALVGVEALVRWRHPSIGLVTPETFITVAEDAGLIHEIGISVLNSTIAQAAKWERQGSPVRVSVNVSASQFNRPDFVSIIAKALETYGLDPHWLELEVTETLTMQNSEAVEARLARLRDMGIAIAVDDFGTGYSNLALLKRLQFDRLKIDRSFVSDIDEFEDARSIVSTILAMAQTFGYDVVAEGVENEQQAAILEAGGCDVLQGYLIARPMLVSEFETWRDSRLALSPEPALARVAG